MDADCQVLMGLLCGALLAYALALVIDGAS